MRRRVAVALGAIACLLASAVPARKTPVDCPGGRFLIQGQRLIPGSGAAPDVVTVERGPRVVFIASGCPRVSAGVLSTPGGTRVHAVWPASACPGLKGRAQLKARILPGCRLLSGTLVARKFRRPFKDAPLSTGCGDGLVDPGLGEECEGATGCGAGQHCVDCTCVAGSTATLPGETTTTTAPGTATTTTTFPAVSSRCCQAVGACFDADPADAEAACRLLSGTLHPSLEVCDGTKGTCGAMKQVGANCCQCPEPSPPFPHPGYCFDTNISSCGPVCTKTAGVACGPDSQTCGGP
ncbi:MAG: hypothetical protein E6J55_15450 [Deltaproteobacteria bacterium]|nr:MAG: hypothetical protein E6J55_15450 [Deltaproteobacteria bacterium]